MKKYELDIQLLLNLIFDVPDNYDIDGIEFSGDNIRIVTSYDYKRVREQEKQQSKINSQQEFEKTLKSFVAALDKNFADIESGKVPNLIEQPKRKRGRPRKTE